MSQATSPSSGQPYGLARVCRVWGVARSTVYWQRHEPARFGARRSPLGPCPDDELVAHIRRVLEISSFPGEGYRKVWARLRHRGIRTSPRRVLRLMRAHHLLAPTRQGHPHGPKAHDGTIISALSRWIITRRSVWVSMRPSTGRGLKHWSPFARGSHRLWGIWAGQRPWLTPSA